MFIVSGRKGRKERKGRGEHRRYNHFRHDAHIGGGGETRPQGGKEGGPALPILNAIHVEGGGKGGKRKSLIFHRKKDEGGEGSLQGIGGRKKRRFCTAFGPEREKATPLTSHCIKKKEGEKKKMGDPAPSCMGEEKYLTNL